jgi:hypothetical protein
MAALDRKSATHPTTARIEMPPKLGLMLAEKAPVCKAAIAATRQPVVREEADPIGTFCRGEAA